MSTTESPVNSSFLRRPPASRLGQAHPTVESFTNAATNRDYLPSQSKEFTLIVVTASPRRILLGRKNRGFGKGYFNSFGGKFENPDERPEDCASRELREETNLTISPTIMRNAKVGILRYTFEGDPVEMIMHLYRIHMLPEDFEAHANNLRSCEEITPQWFDDWHNIPLDQMFADDTHWLPILLSSQLPLEIQGRFHFQKDCQNTNTILDYWMSVKEKSKLVVPLKTRSPIGQVASFDESNAASTCFRHRLPDSRLGTGHETLDSFYSAVSTCGYQPTKTKEYTLIVVTAAPRHILLGHKNRGFGKGMYNSFGGKFDPQESAEDCASRELQEETNISISPIQMRNSKVGILRFTCQDDALEMVIHLFRIHMPRKDCLAYSEIRECEEMTPKWFDDWQAIPLHTMFADDSHWLIRLLSSPVPLEIHGSFHFQPNSEVTNTILHYHMDIKEKPKFTLEQRLFHALHDNSINSPRMKEFKECFAFQNSVRSAFPHPRGNWDVVLDVAGGHGALAALFLIYSSATKAVVIDPAQVGNNGVTRAWKEEFFPKKELVYRADCLRTGLPAELEETLSKTTPDRVLVVACHACQHLSEETLDIACRHGVHVAVMPCCQKDLSHGSVWKRASERLSIPVGQIMDLLLAGKMMACNQYKVRMKMLDSKITPQNRIIICQAVHDQRMKVSKVEAAHTKLVKAYRRVHKVATSRHLDNDVNDSVETFSPFIYMGAGFLAGAVVAVAVLRRL